MNGVNKITYKQYLKMKATVAAALLTKYTVYDVFYNEHHEDSAGQTLIAYAMDGLLKGENVDVFDEEFE